MIETSSTGFVPTWAGDCSNWECDELGHLNMSFYFDKFEQARMGLFIRLGLVNAFRPSAYSTVRCRDAHIKYLAEARPGQPLRIESAVLGLYETDARIGHIMYHRDGRIAATLTETVEHIYLPETKAFAWPSRLTKKLGPSFPKMPGPARPRNLSIETEIPAIDATSLEGQSVPSIGGGVFTPRDTMPAGHVALSSIFRRITTSLGWYADGWPEFNDADYVKNGGSAVVLEVRVRTHQYVDAGTAYDLRPALVAANTHTRLIMHNVLDVVSGASILSGYAAGGLFNLKTRKLTVLTPDQRDTLEKRAVRALAPPRLRGAKT